jgi:hypothetical protein
MPLAMRDNKRARTEQAGNPTANRPKKTTLNGFCWLAKWAIGWQRRVERPTGKWSDDDMV